MRKEIDAEFERHMREIEATKAHLPIIYEKIDDINKRMKQERDRLESFALEDIKPHVQVNGAHNVKWESADFLNDADEEQEREASSKARLFSLNQLRDLFYFHLHRSELKQTVEMAHPTRMNDLESAIQQVDNKLPPIISQIGSERKSIIDIIDAVKFEENQFRLRTNLEMGDVISKIQLLIKEMKANAQMVKLGEKQIDSITEKMDSFKSENNKFKNSMKTKFYEMDKRVNDQRVSVDSEVYRLKTKVESQMEEQGIKFNEMIKNTKELIVEAVKGDIEAGNKLATTLRAEFMHLMEELSEDLQRKLFKFGNRFESYTLSSEAKYSKVMADAKKALKIAEKVSI